jgi:Helix-turn-helix domain
MRGRHPSGPEFVARLHGSATAKQRAQVVLETIAGHCTVGEACERLGISEQRFDQLRIEMLQEGIDRLEPQPAGRRARVETPEEMENKCLKARIAELEARLRAAEVRAEVALTLPQVGAAEKKTLPRPRGRPRRSKPT